jgi:hypothetical protein
MIVEVVQNLAKWCTTKSSKNFFPRSANNAKVTAVAAEPYRLSKEAKRRRQCDHVLEYLSTAGSRGLHYGELGGLLLIWKHYALFEAVTMSSILETPRPLWLEAREPPA